jgi:hypothetical protein
MIETHKIYIAYVITMLSASTFYISNTSVSTLLTSIIHINFKDEGGIDWNGVEEDV